MNVSIMLDELVKHIQKATEKLQLVTQKGTARAPQVVSGYLPPKDPKDIDGVEDFPYVIIRYLSDNSDDDGATAQVKVICGVYSDDDQRGWQDLMNVMNAIRTHLLRQMAFGKCFSVELPVKREIPEEQGAPYWEGWFTLEISIPTILEEDDYVKRFFAE
ncbi:MAG: hypothetical protein H6Q73_3457 [Firmicutes bacterium]|nr:hypothetical protein [Bacillota bacterium]